MQTFIKDRSTFIRQANNVLCYFRNFQSFVSCKLFQSFYTSFYGSELWLLNNRNIDDLCVTWRKTLRKIWNLPYCTHSNLLPLISNRLPLMRFVEGLFISFARVLITIHP